MQATSPVTGDVRLQHAQPHLSVSTAGIFGHLAQGERVSASRTRRHQ
jgi:hypothetical protein